MSIELSGSECCNSTGNTLSLDLTLSGICCIPSRIGSSPIITVQRDLILVTSADFDSAFEWKGANGEGVGILPAYSLKIFYNDGNRYLKEGIEWTRTIDGFILASLNTTSGDMQFYVHINKV